MVEIATFSLYLFRFDAVGNMRLINRIELCFFGLFFFFAVCGVCLWECYGFGNRVIIDVINISILEALKYYGSTSALITTTFFLRFPFLFGAARLLVECILVTVTEFG